MPFFALYQLGMEAARLRPIMHELLSETAHRPWPIPNSSWIMEQTWRDLLFAHWAYPVEQVRAAVPPQLQLDTYDGMAWVGVVPFMLENLRARGLPALPAVSSFPELNVRTYVTMHGKPGVYFFSLDAASKLAVMGARAVFHLNYFDAEICTAQTPNGIEYTSERTDGGAVASFRARYAAAGEIFVAQPGTIDHFLTERYCLYSVSGTGNTFRLEIHHRPWLLQPAEAELDARGMLSAAGLAPARGAPLLHFSSMQPTIGWAPERID